MSALPIPAPGPSLVLPFVWAFAPSPEPPVVLPPEPARPPQPVEEELAFYRKYTEALLRRYARMSMESGRVPSLLGREMFPGKVTSYRVEAFDDVVIFLADVERCLSRLDIDQQHLIARISLQEYSIQETAELLHLRPWTVMRRYGQALDRLTRVFLNVHMLEPQKSCQAPASSENAKTN